jgi:hypothetical protein
VLSDERSTLTRKLRIGFLTAWFADMGDGVRTGDGNDPRVQIIDVVPDEIRYYIETMFALFPSLLPFSILYAPP